MQLRGLGEGDIVEGEVRGDSRGHRGRGAVPSSRGQRSGDVSWGTVFAQRSGEMGFTQEEY